MPQFIIPLIGLAFGMGEGIYGNVAAGSAQDDATKQAQQAQQKAAQDAATQDTAAKDAQKKAIVSSMTQQLPGLQAETGGATSPEYMASIAGTQTGAPGDPNLMRTALQTWLGGGNSPTSSPTGQTSMFPTAAVPSFQNLLPTDQASGVSGASI